MTTPNPTTWATVDDVATYTGTQVTAAQLAQAQAAIDVAAGRSIDVYSSLRSRDLYYLKLATAYQAAWMAAQPDIFTRTEVKQSAGDGMSVQYGDGALVLAPLARRALRRVSWRRSRSVRAVSRTDILLLEEEQWQPYGGTA